MATSTSRTPLEAARTLAAKDRVPVATYRLQLNKGFTFADARNLLDYLQRLGISDIYLSPICEAQAGSEHGYNTVDHQAVSTVLGGEQEFRALAEDIRTRNMGLMVDLVPNHMGIGDETNRLWWDVLENGPSSPYASFFDIDWTPPKTDLANQVLLPVLGDQYGLSLEAGYLRLDYRDGSFIVRYFDRVFPVAPRSATVVLTAALERGRPFLPEGAPAIAELESVITHLRNLPLRTETDLDRIRERQREKDVARRRLQALLTENEILRGATESAIAYFNGHAGEPHSFNPLDALLSDQAYRLCYWRVAADEINYRRFFDINELAAIRAESPAVFGAIHELIFRFAGQGLITAARIDHIDGLQDPERYLEDLQAGYRVAGGGDAMFRVIIEKILGEGEKLNPAWKTHGTVGYDFLNLVNGVFVDRDRANEFRELYARFTGEKMPFAEEAHLSKKLILLVALTSELHVLAGKLDRISEQHRWSRDFTASSLKFALREVIAAFPVYRTYIRENTVAESDRSRVHGAIREAKRRNPATSASIFDFIATVLLMEDPPGLSAKDIAARREFVMRFQQLTAPVMAKGVEDTAFYRSYALASLNEVGGDPRRFGTTIREFHAGNLERLQNWPCALLSTATHDTKRGEDTRARLDAVSEIPARWEQAIRSWRTMNARHRITLDGEDTPSSNEEYLLYQTLVGTWPMAGMPSEEPNYAPRVIQYMEKALREAKQHTSWIKPNEPHDEAVRRFVHCVLDPEMSPDFLESFSAFVAPLVRAGAWNSLVQLVLKATSPGVPDFYQGTEFWDFSLVDPDNRRPVDFAARRRALEDFSREAVPGAVLDLAANPADGRIKMLITLRALEVRNRMQSVFEAGEYIPLEVAEDASERVVAFARHHEGRGAIVVAGRFHLKDSGHATLDDVVGTAWGGAAIGIPDVLSGRYRDAFTGQVHLLGARDRSSTLLSRIFRFLSPPPPLAEGAVAPQGELAVSKALKYLPVALLEREGGL